ncbi:MAG: hypothetical protein IJN32_09620, partial [Thermoguttaceae bacterium]|nr:hypothetical protein [Thermoguttaceae bacterium]
MNDCDAFSFDRFPKTPFLPDVPLERWTPSDGDRDEFFMRAALVEARLAAEEGETPIGAVLVCQNRILVREHNRRER